MDVALEDADAAEMAEAAEVPAPSSGGGKQRTTDDAGRRFKGRGVAGSSSTIAEGGRFDSIHQKGGGGKGPVESIEGFIVFVSGLHDEAVEDDVHDKFCDFGDIKNLHLNLDRRTGFAKGYALVEYVTAKEAQAAIDNMDGETVMGQKVKVDWAFSRGPSRAKR